MMISYRHVRLPHIIALAAMSLVDATTMAQTSTDDRTGSSSTPTASTSQTDRQSELLKKAAKQVRLEIDKNWNNYLGGSDGFNSIGFTADTVIIHWSGAVPANVTKAIERARRIAPVRVQVAQYSRIQLKAAARRIGNHIDGLAATESMHSIYVVNNNSIRVEVTPGYDTFAAKAALPEVGVPVEVTEGEPIELTSRSDDSAPWKGGAFFHSLRDGRVRAGCTTGFGVYQSGHKYILTAAHCATAPDW